MKNRRLTIYNLLQMILPDVIIWRRNRVRVLRWCGAKIGVNVEIGSRVIVRGEGELTIGDNCRIYDDVYFLCKKNSSITLGKSITIGTRAYFENGGLIDVGDGCGIWQSALLTANCGSRITIGPECKIAHFVSLKTTTHKITPDVCRRGGGCIGMDDEFRDITVGEGSWICAGAIILPGVSVGNKCIVAAGAVVTKNTPNYVLLAGVPAEIKKHYAS